MVGMSPTARSAALAAAEKFWVHASVRYPIRIATRSLPFGSLIGAPVPTLTETVPAEDCADPPPPAEVPLDVRPLHAVSSSASAARTRPPVRALLLRLIISVLRNFSPPYELRTGSIGIVRSCVLAPCLGAR